MKKSLLAILLLALLAPAHAQDAVAEEVPQQPGTDELGTVPVTEMAAQPEALPSTEPPSTRQLDEVIVTAQKTRQSARKVPISMTAMGGDFIKQTGAASLADVSLYIPNVRMEARDYGSPQVFIRGFGTNSFNPSFESSVALVQDELYFGRPGYFTEAMFDLERLEVLRGPQGTLFGKNTVAGVFNITSKGPSDEFSADGSYFYGEHEEQRVEGGAGGMVTDWFGFRVSGLYIDRGGQFENQFLGRKEDAVVQRAGRAKLKFVLGYNFESELTAVESQTNAPFWPLQLMQLDEGTRSYLEQFDPNIEDDPYDFNTSMNKPGWIEKGSSTIGLRSHWFLGDFGPLNDFDPVLVLGWSKFRIDQYNELDASPADLLNLDNHEDHEQRSAELRFTGNFDSLFGLGKRVEFVLGGYAFKSDYTLLAQIQSGGDLGSYVTTCDFRQLALVPEAGCTLTEAVTGLVPLISPLLGQIAGGVTAGDQYRLDYDQAIDARAFFGQLTWNVTDQLALTQGVRINKETKLVDSRGRSECVTKEAGVPQDPNSTCIIDALVMSHDYSQPDLRRDETDVSPKFAVQWFGDAINYYASYTRGYKSGGFNAISFDGRDASELAYEPEKARTWEAGAKGRFFNRTLAVNLGFYDTLFENLQVLAFNGVFFTVSNAGEAYSRGLEADFTWITPLAPLRIMGSGALLDAKYIHYRNAPAPISQGVGVTIDDAAGQRLAFAPRSTATLTPTLSHVLFGNYIVTLAGDVLWQGEQFTDVDNDPASRVGGYTKYAARLMLADTAGHWSLAIGGTNLSDKRVLNQVTDALFFPNTYFVHQAAGRQLFAMVSAKF
jgi:iron complex outermembrane receptor protein